jgi:hypothetical protein
MTDKAILIQTVAAYVLTDAKEGTPDWDRRLAAHEAVRTWIDSDPEQAWRFIEAAYQSEMTDEELAVVAAGAVEDFLAAHGEQYFVRLETAVRRDARARFMVAGVWQGGMSDPLWGRFLAMRQHLGIAPI